jgi:hypothetical protein
MPNLRNLGRWPAGAGVEKGGVFVMNFQERNAYRFVFEIVLGKQTYIVDDMRVKDTLAEIWKDRGNLDGISIVLVRAELGEREVIVKTEPTMWRSIDA